jgi:hypothetical protein
MKNTVKFKVDIMTNEVSDIIIKNTL